ncbi:MAG: 43, APCd gp43 [Xanthobacteraceae bacterium]|nr:43, APCd gp43 [Xanthobacteraceae bacterium]
MNALTHSAPMPGAEESARIFYRDQPVMTTEQLAAAYGVNPKNIHDIHQAHSSRFEEGRHYYRLSGADLREFKNYPANSGVVGMRAPHLTLWTEHGALRHAKLLESSKAWEVFGKLEETYFAVRAAAAPVTGPERFKIARENRLQFERHLSWARVMGLSGAHAMLAANRATIIATGHDTLGALGVLSAPDAVQEIVVIPTAIGEKLGGLSAQAVNSHLAAMGLQEREPLHKGKWRWKLTQAGLDAGGRYDVQSRSNNTGTARFIEWPLSVVDSVRTFLKGEEGETA